MEVATMGDSTWSCLGRTCLQWGSDGDLARQDMELVLERLARVDRDLAAERQALPLGTPG